MGSLGECVSREAYQAPPSNVATTSSGSGASLSSPIQIFPLSSPGRRGAGMAAIPTKSATGLPALVMMISSPRATSLAPLLWV